MQFWFPILFTAAVLIVGSIVAIAWWRLAARAAPYADEKLGKPREDHSEDVVFVKTPSSPTDDERAR